MTLLLAAALLALLAAGIVIHPILARRSALLGDTAPGRIVDAEARRRTALVSLQEVEYDFRAGKLDAVDYAALRGQLGHEALQAIRVADEVGGTAAPPAPPPPQRVPHSCGFLNPSGSRFCAGCGARVG